MDSSLQVRFFKALADETRQEILRILHEVDELCVSDLCGRFQSVSQPTISHHLQVLRACELVSSRRQGKMIFYQIRRAVLHDVGSAFLLQFRVQASAELEPDEDEEG